MVMWQCCGPGMFFKYLWSRIWLFHPASRSPNPGLTRSRIRICIKTRNWYSVLKKISGCSSRITDQGVKIAPDPGSRFPDPHPQHCVLWVRVKGPQKRKIKLKKAAEGGERRNNQEATYVYFWKIFVPENGKQRLKGTRLDRTESFGSFFVTWTVGKFFVIEDKINLHEGLLWTGQ